MPRLTDTAAIHLNGAVSARLVSHLERSFIIEATLDLHKGAAFFGTKPPLHFHVQEEYIEATQGKIVLEIDGVEKVLTPTHGRVTIPPYLHHRSFPAPLSAQGEGPDNHIVKFLLSGEKKSATQGGGGFEPNAVFFENWYKYQDEIVIHGGKVDLIQVLCTFDAGGTYVSFPWWVPMGKTVSIVLGIVVGRWIGSGLLGYQPLHR
ncbi:putative 4-hydroxybenzoate polyprenyl transferase [Rhypophila decipiens]|uniref:4-hydroxybenzoate polyprenyl transferase n=1 Tax=Rhypophila decipiens TaxID=261697 RepID=A0AAN6XVR6_9PEZI|nr:putative 4-hydroxybenzoate polyprenyl transferase [Rhypophila decipiens]